MQDQKVSDYSPVPKARRGNRRASNNSPYQDQLEPKIGLNPLIVTSGQKKSVPDEDDRSRWIKEQKPPHWG